MVRFLAVDVSHCEGLPVKTNGARNMVRCYLGSESSRSAGGKLMNLVKGSSSKSASATTKSTPFALLTGASPNWFEYGEKSDARAVDKDAGVAQFSTSIAAGRGSERSGQGSGHGAGFRLEFRLDSNGFGDSDEDHFAALRGGMTVVVLSRDEAHNLDLAPKKKEICSAVVSGGDLMDRTGVFKTFSLRDKRDQRAGEITLRFSILRDEIKVLESTPVEVIAGSQRHDVAKADSSSSSSSSDGEKIFDPYAPTAEQLAHDEAVRAKLQAITCPLCRQIYVDPVILGNCRHAVCRTCVWQAVGDGKQKAMQCPSCAVTCNLGYGGTNGLTPARHLHPELTKAGFLANCNKVDPSKLQNGSGPGLYPRLDTQSSNNPSPVNPFASPHASSVAPPPRSGNADDDIWSRLQSRAASNEQNRVSQEQQQRAEKGAAASVIAPEFGGMGSGYVRP